VQKKAKRNLTKRRRLEQKANRINARVAQVVANPQITPMSVPLSRFLRDGEKKGAKSGWMQNLLGSR